MDPAALGAAFVLVFLMELGDKTQLMAISLSARYDAKTVFLAVSLALVVATLLGVAIGTVLFTFLPVLWIRGAAAVAFIIFGITMLIEREERGEEKEDADRGHRLDRRVFTRAFGLTFVAEMGDKTQLAAVALTASLVAPVEVFLGASSALVTISAIGVFIGTIIGTRLKRRWLTGGGAVLFIAIGAYMLIELLL